ncbi:MAG TPA: hypothetical protein VGF61_05365 [Candidatus Acidoferrum sp.]
MISISRSARNSIFSCFVALALLASSTFAAQAQTAAGDDPDAKEIATYSLSMDGIRHLATATGQLKEWEQKNPDAAKGMDGDELKNAASVTEQAKIFDSKFPQGTAILKKNGLSTREYLISLYAFVQAAMIVAFKKAGQAPEADKLTGVINPANIDLIEKNWDEVQKLNAALGLPGGAQ